MKRTELERRLRTFGDPVPPPGLRSRLERGIPDSFQRPEPAWSPGRWSIMARVGMVTAAATVVLAVALWVGTSILGPGVAFAEVLEPVAEATGNAGAVHMVLRMLTGPGEDFSFVNLSGPMERVEAWVQWPDGSGRPGRIRIDKRDRIYCSMGTRTIFYHPLRKEAFVRRGAPLDVDLLWPAAWVQQIRGLPPEGVEVLEHSAKDGRGYLHLREKGVDTAPREPAFLGEFDRETEVEWDLATFRLTGLRRWVDHHGERRLFSELATIEYLPTIDDKVFQLDLPEDLLWGGVKPAPPELASLGPREVARRLFEAALEGDRETLGLLVPSPRTVEWLLDEANRPVEIAFIGEPFRTGAYEGVYVPYRVRMGLEMKSHRLALRNDNGQGRWVFDGGI